MNNIDILLYILTMLEQIKETIQAHNDAQHFELF